MSFENKYVELKFACFKKISKKKNYKFYDIIFKCQKSSIEAYRINLTKHDNIALSRSKITVFFSRFLNI